MLKIKRRGGCKKELKLAEKNEIKNFRLKNPYI